MQRVYLDNNATTALCPAASKAMSQAAVEFHGNPASQHQPGRLARRRLEQARDAIAGLVGASTAGMRRDRLIFTSGGTEANNHALRGAVGEDPRGKRLILSGIEHPSVALVASHLETLGARVERLPANQDGVVDVRQLAASLTPETSLVSVMLGSNETGVLQPLQEVVAACQALSVPVHTDATQVVGKLPVDFQQLGVAMLSFSAHKFHGPRGIGGLVVRHGFALPPLLHGQAGGERPGTPPVELSVGMQVALQAWQAEQPARQHRMLQLRDLLEELVLSDAPDAVVVGRQAARLPHTSCIALPGIDRQAAQMALDREGVACSTGSACASGSSEPSPTLVAMGLETRLVQGALRFSLGAQTTREEILFAASKIVLVFRRLQAQKTL
ncbi:MAG: cysteine desulfurase [Planctomycetales bacterium]|nr:cysteine desulfurase [Planctomycetales bacterium]